MKKGNLKFHKKMRLIIQAFWTALSNGFLKGFISGKIYDGPLKYVCVPGLNCYSCPSAFSSCPIGALQTSLSSREFNISFYVTGFLIVFGTLFGRAVCTFLCPFGFIQDLLFKIPFVKKLRKLPGEKFLRCARFFILAVFVIILPMIFADITGLGEPWFCKFICPAGTLEGGIPLLLLNNALRQATGFLYRWKIFILIFIIIFSLLISRPFCRYFCPLGAIYGLFNKISLYRIEVDSEKCINCGKCLESCSLSIDISKTPKSADCIMCGECKFACPAGAIRISGEKQTPSLKNKTSS